MVDIISGDLQTFILRYIDTIAQLEALLLLRANAQEQWDAAKVAARLYISEAEVDAALRHLCEEQFLTADGGAYRYTCHDPALQSLVDRLAIAYAKHLIPVTNLIHSKPRRIREFADAFKFRKDQ